MQLREQLFGATATLLLGAALALPSASYARSQAPAGAHFAPQPVLEAGYEALVLEDLDGKRVSLSALRGKVVLLNFWATWCKPCMDEMPVLADLAQRFHGQGFVVVAASLDESDSRSTVERFAAAMPKGMEIWVGATSEDLDKLKLGAALPVTVLLDRSGGLAARQRGPLQQGTLDSTIVELLGVKGQERPDKPEKPRFDGAIQAKSSTTTNQAAGLN